MSLVAAIVALAAGSAPSAAQAPPVIDGRTFSEVNLPAPVQAAGLSMSAARSWTWREGNTERVLLDRDVRVTLGPYSFRAKKASVWLEPVRIEGRDAEQVALYFAEVSDPAGAVGLSQQADRLLVTAVIARIEPVMKTDLKREGRPEDPFVAESEARLARYLSDLAAPAPAGDVDRTAGGVPPSASAGEAPEWLTRDDREPLPPAERSPAEFPRTGLVNFFSDTVEVVDRGEGERAALLTGGVVVEHLQSGESGRPGPTVQLSAERAVVFLANEADAAAASFGAEAIRGVYLEGDVVATTGRYTLRGSRVFYDVRTDRAVVIDAIFWTYDEERGMPLYLRADAIRQESRDQWSAKNVRLANVGFAEPHFSIGATTVTITNAPRDRPAGTIATGRPRTLVDARGVSFRFGEVPVLGVPRLSGELRPSILRTLSIDSEEGDPIIRTGWDLYAIAGMDPADGNEATLLLDGYFNRGPAAGLDVEWRTPAFRGAAFLYGIYDDGRDNLPSGGEVEQDNEFRGVAEAEQVWRLSDHWTLFLEGSYISDETFIPAFFRPEAETRREYTNSAYFRSLDGSSLFSLEARGTFNDFIANQQLLQSLGYATQKLPEAVYTRLGDDLFDGLLSYSSETRLSVMRLAFSEPTSRELGYRTASKARAAFGLTPDESIAEVLRAQGVSEENTYRADTRHELEMPLRWGALNVVPFVTGRATAWDSNFDEFSGQNNEPYRLWGSAGIRFATSILKVDESMESSLLDLHRMRHIIEPGATIWTAGANLSQNDLPIYDDAVESIATGTAVRAGVRNTWQTQRGGADRWRSVDWLVINTNYVWSSDDADFESPYGRFIEAQPEQSNLGRFLANDAVLQLTDAVAITSDLVYDFENQSLARITAGGIIDHGFGFSTLMEYRYLDSPRATLVDLGARYEFTRKYAATITGTVDAERSEFQTIGARLERRFPQWTVDFRIGVDNITNDVSLGVALRPVGLGGERRTRIFTRDPAGVVDRPLLAPERRRLDWGPFGVR